MSAVAKARHPLEQLAHDVRNSAGLVTGALAELKASLGPSAEDHELFLRIASRGVRQLLVLADRCAVEGEHARAGAPADATGADLEASLRTALDHAHEAFGKKSLKIELAPLDAPLRLRGSARWIGVVLTESVLLALRSASKTAKVTVLDDGENATISLENDGTRPAIDDDSPEGRAFHLVATTLDAMGGHVTTSAKAFRLLLTLPLAKGDAATTGAA